MKIFGKLIKNLILGFIIGVFIGETIFLFTLIFGNYTISVDKSTMITQYLLAGIVGAAFAGSSTIYYMKSWSLFKKTFIQLLIAVPVYFTACYIGGWIRAKSFFSIILYIISFFIIFFIVWFIFVCFWKTKINKLNKHLESRNK